MSKEGIVESLLGQTTQKKKSRIPARLDFLQSATGLFLAIFMISLTSSMRIKSIFSSFYYK